MQQRRKVKKPLFAPRRRKIVPRDSSGEETPTFFIPRTETALWWSSITNWPRKNHANASTLDSWWISRRDRSFFVFLFLSSEMIITIDARINYGILAASFFGRSLRKIFSFPTWLAQHWLCIGCFRMNVDSRWINFAVWLVILGVKNTLVGSFLNWQAFPLKICDIQG